MGDVTLRPLSRDLRPFREFTHELPQTTAELLRRPAPISEDRWPIRLRQMPLERDRASS